MCKLQKDRRVRRDLRKRVISYYGYLFMLKRWTDNRGFFQLLPTATQIDYCYVANREVFDKVQNMSAVSEYLYTRKPAIAN